jgi:hypothetical protein
MVFNYNIIQAVCSSYSINEQRYNPFHRANIKLLDYREPFI